MSQVNIRKIFKANCGPGAQYLSSGLQQRGEHNTVSIRFRMVPENRTFDMDGVIHEGETDDEQLRNAVLKIALKVRNIRAVLAAPDGSSAVHVDRLLS